MPVKILLGYQEQEEGRIFEGIGEKEPVDFSLLQSFNVVYFIIIKFFKKTVLDLGIGTILIPH